MPVSVATVASVSASGVSPPPRPRRTTGGSWSKRCADLALAAPLLLLASPVMLVLALLVRLTSRGPALYCQTRVGLGGKPFRIYKFRTMRHNCEKDSGVQWSRPGDSRVTRLGNFLRTTHLDELPQLLNVLLGHMSLVGPRPERPEFVPQLTAAVPGYDSRLQVRPGVTGLAQVYLPADTDLDSVRRKLVYDRWYIEHRSLWLDVRLIACTALKVVRLPMATCCHLFRLPDPGRMGNGEWGMGNAEQAQTARTEGLLQSPIPNPHSPFVEMEAVR